MWFLSKFSIYSFKKAISSKYLYFELLHVTYKCQVACSHSAQLCKPWGSRARKHHPTHFQLWLFLFHILIACLTCLAHQEDYGDAHEKSTFSFAHTMQLYS